MATLLWPSTAAAEPVTVCLAVASVVFGAIQAHNASDGGLRGMLQATLDYQRAMSNQLESIQHGISDTLQRLGTLQGAVDSLPEETVMRQILTELGGASRQYRKVIERSAMSGYAGYAAWRNAKDVQNELEQIAIVLNRSFSMAEYSQWLGPVLSLCYVSATHTLLAIKHAQGLTTPQLSAYAVQQIQAYRLFEDPAIATSTAARSQEHQRRFGEAVGALAKLGFVVGPANEPEKTPTSVVLSSVFIQDYEAPKLLMTESRLVEGRFGKGEGVTSTIGVKETWSKERVGDTEHFQHRASITAHYDTIPGNPPMRLRRFSVEPALTTSTVATIAPTADPSRYVSSAVAGAKPERFLAGTPEIRRQIAVDDSHKVAAVKKQALISAEVDKLNLAAAQMTLCESALLNLRASRQVIEQSFGIKA